VEQRENAQEKEKRRREKTEIMMKHKKQTGKSALSREKKSLKLRKSKKIKTKKTN